MNMHSMPLQMHTPMVSNHCFVYSHVLCSYSMTQNQYCRHHCMDNWNRMLDMSYQTHIDLHSLLQFLVFLYRFHLMWYPMLNHWHTFCMLSRHTNMRSMPLQMHSPMGHHHYFVYSHVLCSYSMNLSQSNHRLTVYMLNCTMNMPDMLYQTHSYLHSPLQMQLA